MEYMSLESIPSGASQSFMEQYPFPVSQLNLECAIWEMEGLMSDDSSRVFCGFLGEHTKHQSNMKPKYSQKGQ